MIMLDLDHLAYDACRLLCDSAKNLLSMLLHARFAYLGHLSVSRVMGGGKTVSMETLAPIRLAKATPCWTAFPASSDPSVGIRIWVYI